MASEVSGARKAVLRVLAERADHFAEMEQLLVQEGKYADAEGAHKFGMWCLRAYKGEADDPKPLAEGDPEERM